MIVEPVPGEEKLKNERWEEFAQSSAKGLSPEVSYMHAYGMKNRAAAKRAAYRILKDKRAIARVEFLVREKALGKKSKTGTNLQQVIKTCLDIVETSDKTSEKMSAITTLNKLKVFDDDRDDSARMDPGMICEYLASFAASPVSELEHIPGGLQGLMERVMDLTGASKDVLKQAIDDIKPGRARKPIISLINEDPKWFGKSILETALETMDSLKEVNPNEPIEEQIEF